MGPSGAAFPDGPGWSHHISVGAACGQSDRLACFHRAMGCANGRCFHTHLQFQDPFVPRIIVLFDRSFGNSEFQMALKAAVIDIPGLFLCASGGHPTLCCVLRRGTGRQMPTASARLGGNSTQSSQIPFSALAAPSTVTAVTAVTL